MVQDYLPLNHAAADMRIYLVFVLPSHSYPRTAVHVHSHHCGRHSDNSPGLRWYFQHIYWPVVHPGYLQTPGQNPSNPNNVKHIAHQKNNKTSWENTVFVHRRPHLKEDKNWKYRDNRRL